MMFDWKDAYSVAFGEIDDLHRQVFRAAGELHAAIEAAPPQTSLDALLTQLLACTRGHLEAEEALMLASGYPQTARHKGAHEVFAEKLLASERAWPDAALAQTVKDFLIRHIDEEDRELGRYLAARAG